MVRAGIDVGVVVRDVVLMTIHERIARIARQELSQRYASVQDQAEAMAAAVITELGLVEERQVDCARIPETALVLAGGVEIKTNRGQGWAHCQLCDDRESGCYADLCKWAAEHVRDVHDEQPRPERLRFVTDWEPVETEADPHAGQLWANELQRRQRQVPSDREWS